MKRCGFCGFMTDLVILLNRVALGGYFLAAGWGKVLKEGGLEEFQNFYTALVDQMTESGKLPAYLVGENWQGFHHFYMTILPYAELALGALLIIGLLARLSSLLMTGMLVSFTLALYGADKFFAGSGPFHTNVILAMLALLLVFIGAGRFSIDRWLFGSCCGRGEPEQPQPVAMPSIAPTPPTEEPPSPTADDFKPTNQED